MAAESFCDACGRSDTVSEIVLTDDEQEWPEWWCPACLAELLSDELTADDIAAGGTD